MQERLYTSFVNVHYSEHKLELRYCFNAFNFAGLFLSFLSLFCRNVEMATRILISKLNDKCFKIHYDIPQAS